MRSDSVNGTGGGGTYGTGGGGAHGTGSGGLAVPMAWLCAEYTAGELLADGGLAAPGSLEYEAARRALALTVYLDDRPLGGAPEDGGRVEDPVARWLLRTAHGHPWPRWVGSGLTEAGDGGTDGGGVALARAAWRRLEATQLLAADLGGPDGAAPGRGPGADPARVTVDESRRVWMPSWQVALPLVHLTLRLL
ncbi:hypothetical protein [Streptomyces sp. NPDC046887]|uniref:hypothetical protein n=1 Tax=Streptomyces sp. NPDC046887 TaxID=3155472 RepID=UPI0033E6F7F1